MERETVWRTRTRKVSDKHRRRKRKFGGFTCSHIQTMNLLHCLCVSEGESEDFEEEEEEDEEDVVAEDDDDDESGDDEVSWGFLFLSVFKTGKQIKSVNSSDC